MTQRKRDLGTPSDSVEVKKIPIDESSLNTDVKNFPMVQKICHNIHDFMAILKI